MALMPVLPWDTSAFMLVVAALRGLDGVVAKIAGHRHEIRDGHLWRPADDLLGQRLVAVSRQRVEDASCLRRRPGCARREWVVAFARPHALAVDRSRRA